LLNQPGAYLRIAGQLYKNLPLTQEDIPLLIEGCKKNDRKAQELFYKKFYAAMASLCVRYTTNQSDAMEVLNDGFLKIFRSIHTYDERKAAVYTWMRTIMINTALDFLRKRRIVYASNLSAAVESASIESTVIEKMEADELLALIKKLPQATQLVFNLHTVEGYSHSEIAGLLRISEGTSRWHLSEARKQLRESIAQLQKLNE
jgi:RNA polymerase sigma factor (sigma-70 family)